jgi:YggT family protein
MPVVRYAVFGLVVVAGLVALASWLLRSRRISPFSALGRTLRALTEPVMRPVERRIVRMGGNPTHAGGWLVILTAVAGVLLVSLAGWLYTTFLVVQASARAGPRQTVVLIFDLVYRILFIALIVRVIATWFGMFRYSRWIRPAYILTDWLVEPIRRILPTVSGWDLSPIVAVIALSLLRQLLVSAVLR